MELWKGMDEEEDASDEEREREGRWKVEREGEERECSGDEEGMNLL